MTWRPNDCFYDYRNQNSFVWSIIYLQTKVVFSALVLLMLRFTAPCRSLSNRVSLANAIFASWYRAFMCAYDL